jgi:hypothetical protein
MEYIAYAAMSLVVAAAGALPVWMWIRWHRHPLPTAPKTARER